MFTAKLENSANCTIVMAYTKPMARKRFVDLSENSLYWYFIVAWWVPIYLIIYWAPRWL